MANNSFNQSNAGENFGRAAGLIVLLIIGLAVYYFFFTPDDERLSKKYNVPKRVYAQPKPHGCAYNDAPLGDKHCHYEKHVVVYAKNGLVIEEDGESLDGVSFVPCLERGTNLGEGRRVKGEEDQTEGKSHRTTCELDVVVRLQCRDLSFAKTPRRLNFIHATHYKRAPLL